MYLTVLTLIFLNTYHAKIINIRTKESVYECQFDATAFESELPA